MNNPPNDVHPCWINTIDPADASPELAEMYSKVGAVHNKIHNLYRAFSLQPAPLIAADQHYRDILHNPENKTEPWFLELLASQAAIIADCEYALANQGRNFKDLLGHHETGDLMLEAVKNDQFEPPLFTEKQIGVLRFGAKLCRSPEKMSEMDVENLRSLGATDIEILEAVQSTACFAYWVRFINGLGIQLGNETIGLFGND